MDKKPGGGIVGLVIGWPYLWFKILPSFMLGMAAHAFKDTLPRSRALLIALTTTAVAAANLSPHLANLVVAPALAYAIFYFAFSQAMRFHGAAQWGDFSYGTYLYAFTIQQIGERAEVGHPLGKIRDFIGAGRPRRERQQDRPRALDIEGHRNGHGATLRRVRD